VVSASTTLPGDFKRIGEIRWVAGRLTQREGCLHGSDLTARANDGLARRHPIAWWRQIGRPA
jgi:hypothetical protein